MRIPIDVHSFVAIPVFHFRLFCLAVNTSVNKSEMGVSPGSDAVSLTNHILQNGSHLNLKGFMTIGGSDHDSSTGNVGY